MIRMIPGERHDGPGLSSMGMKLIPRYADEGAGGSAAPGVAIDPASLQRLGAADRHGRTRIVVKLGLGNRQHRVQ